jgi:hypothetical protein
MSTSQEQAAGQNGKPADYVYFDRTTAGFSDEAVPRAKTAQLKLEHYYKEAVDSAIERNTRCEMADAGHVVGCSGGQGLTAVNGISVDE